MKDNKIIGLCIFLCVFVSMSFYKMRFDENAGMNNSNIYLENQINKINNIYKEIVEEINTISSKKTVYSDLDFYEKNCFRDIEFNKLIYLFSVKNNVEILNKSKKTYLASYNKYNLSYISIELKSNLNNIKKYIKDIELYHKIIDFSKSNITISEKSTVLTIGYISSS